MRGTSPYVSLLVILKPVKKHCDEMSELLISSGTFDMKLSSVVGCARRESGLPMNQKVSMFH